MSYAWQPHTLSTPRTLARRENERCALVVRVRGADSVKRADLINALTFAGYHGDVAGAQRLYVEHRISLRAAGDAYARGAEAKNAGTKCGCPECLKK